MPKGFTEQEKELIRDKLLTEGARLFDQYGVQKTTVDDIAGASGISKGSFYSFFNSKEELFFDILEKTEREFKAKLFGEVFPESESPRESFKAFLDGFFTLMESTPIFKRLISSDMEYLMRKLPEKRIKDHMAQDYEVFETFYQTWNKKGVFRTLDMKGFTGVTKLIFYLVLHREDYTQEEYAATKAMFIDMLGDYLITK
ncbi:MAG: TetR/AcrR family transcriptional regulator [Spirochaetales bacterium]|nr:TetR/AcrR family transcriptional regulator [Spirochaetales bacterium]